MINLAYVNTSDGRKYALVKCTLVGWLFKGPVRGEGQYRPYSTIRQACKLHHILHHWEIDMIVAL